jgi:hypothetical protein
MYQDLKVSYWWYGMKREVAEYVALCDTCQRVKVELRNQEVCALVYMGDE